ncbi:MAG: alpha/beta hydrolase [Mucilaginibacter sp.]|nr:alpha/beta hydrolase [Mucilaginibacter sp.]
MKIFFSLLLSSIFFTSIAQKRDNRIVIGTIDTVYSKILNEKRVIYVHVPDGDKNQRYPVLYILDGENHFQSAVAIVQQISGITPDMIVIGITNSDRERDLTPTHVNPDRIINASDARKSGGGENFISFIEKELIPYIDAHYPTTSYRVLSGHSLGGLAVVNAFINHTNLFNAYIAIDPSLWWDGQKWIKKYESELSQHNFSNRALFVGIANNLPAGLDTISVLKDTSINYVLTRSVLNFAHTLHDLNSPGLRLGSKFYPNEWHGSVELNAEYDALRYLFKFYHFDMNYVRAHPGLNPDSLVSAHFNKVSKQMGYQVLPTEEMINDMAYGYMGMQKMNYAYALFKRNIENYPESSNAWDSLGDYYASAGDKQKAIEAYSKSLSLRETQDTRSKLEVLKGKK